MGILGKLFGFDSPPSIDTAIGINFSRLGSGKDFIGARQGRPSFGSAMPENPPGPAPGMLPEAVRSLDLRPGTGQSDRYYSGGYGSLREPSGSMQGPYGVGDRLGEQVPGGVLGRILDTPDGPRIDWFRDPTQEGLRTLPDMDVEGYKNRDPNDMRTWGAGPIPLTDPEAYKNRDPNDLRTLGTPLSAGMPPSTRKFAPLFQKYAEQSDYLTAEDLGKLAHIESRGNPRAVSPTGAKGLFQFTGGTFKGLGIGGDRFDPEVNTKAAVMLANQNGRYLERKLGRKPLAAEIYMAHNIGAGGAMRLLTADPNARVSQSLIGSNPKHNPYFLMDGKRPAMVRDAVQRYYDKF